MSEKTHIRGTSHLLQRSQVSDLLSFPFFRDPFLFHSSVTNKKIWSLPLPNYQPLLTTNPKKKFRFFSSDSIFRWSYSKFWRDLGYSDRDFGGR